jgi:hypothetical protein
VERKKWNRSEGARKRSARRWTNWGLTPPGKLARYANCSEGSSSGGSCYSLAPPVNKNNEEEKEAPRGVFNRGNNVLNEEEEETAIQQVAVISEAEAHTRFRREEERAVRQAAGKDDAVLDEAVNRSIAAFQSKRCRLP